MHWFLMLFDAFWLGNDWNWQVLVEKRTADEFCW